MRPSARMGFVGIVGFAGALIARPSRLNAQGTAASSAAPARVTLIGTDYAFVDPPGKIAAGPTLFAFENRGKKRHELSLLRLTPGLTVQQALEAPGGVSSRAVAEKIIGVLVVRPGDASGGQLLVELKSGERYLIVCTLKDSPDAVPHMKLGMINAFDVP